MVLNKERLRLERKILKTKEIKELGILTSLYSGLRIGEMCALRWSDINFEDNLINITHTLQRVYVDRTDTKVIIGNPKTQKSIRKIPIAKPLLSKLKEIQPYYPKEAYILTRQNR